jgi:hypothetical protein
MYWGLLKQPDKQKPTREDTLFGEVFTGRGVSSSETAKGCGHELLSSKVDFVGISRSSVLPLRFDDLCPVCHA